MKTLVVELLVIPAPPTPGVCRPPKNCARLYRTGDEDALITCTGYDPNKDTAHIVAALVQAAGMLLQREADAENIAERSRIAAQEFMGQVMTATGMVSPVPDQAPPSAGKKLELVLCDKCGGTRLPGAPCQTCEMLGEGEHP